MNKKISKPVPIVAPLPVAPLPDAPLVNEPPIETATLTVKGDTWRIRILHKRDADGFFMMLPAEREIILGRAPDADGFFAVMLGALAISLNDRDMLDYANSP